jgi:oligopeptide transport system substrate-binding protein
MRPLLALVVLVLCAGLTAPWWGGARQLIPANAPRLASTGIITLDPTQTSTLDEFRVLGALFEGLVHLDPQTLAVVPGIAERWECAADQRTWTFHLGNRMWSDGSPVTAGQMADGLRLHLAGSASGALLAGLDQPLVRDANTLELRTRGPMPWLPNVLATPVFIPLHPSLRDGSRWTDPVDLITNGPLRCVDYAPRHHLDLQPSATYSGPAPAVGPLRLLVVDNPGTAVRLYLDGRLDAVLSLNSDTIGDLVRCGSPDLQSCAAWGTEFYRVRQAGSRAGIPLALRQALARSVDSEALVRDLLHGNGARAIGLVPAGAAALGYPVRDHRQAIPDLRGLDLPPLELVVPANQPERLRLAEWLIDRWHRDLGVTITLSAVPGNLAVSRTKALDYDLARGSLVGDYLDPAYFLTCFRAESGMNRTGWADAVFTGLLDAADQASGPARLKLLAQAETRLLDQGVVIPLFHYACSFLVKPGLHGIRANALELVRLADVGR